MLEERPFPEGLKGEEVGRVVGYFSVPQAAIVKIQRGSLKVGDRIWIRGRTTDLLETVQSLQVDHQPVLEAKLNNEAGVQVSARVRRNDRVYKVSS